MENIDSQWLIDLIKSLKSKGFIYNDTDFSKKTGINKTFLSGMKNGKQIISEQTVQKIKEAFPEHFGLEIHNENNCPLCAEKDKRIAVMEKYIKSLEDQIALLKGADTKKEKRKAV